MSNQPTVAELLAKNAELRILLQNKDELIGKLERELRSNEKIIKSLKDSGKPTYETSQAGEKFLELNEKMLQVNQEDIFEDTHVHTYYRNPADYKIDRITLQMKMVKEQMKLLQQQIDKIST